MKKINIKNLSLLVIELILVSYIVIMFASVYAGIHIGAEGLVKIFLAMLIAEPITEELVRILNK